MVNLHDKNFPQKKGLATRSSKMVDKRNNCRFFKLKIGLLEGRLLADMPIKYNCLQRY